MSPPIIPAVLGCHAEEAAFLWLLRDRAVGQPHYALRSLVELDQRVEAHIDGLRVAGDDGWGLAKTGLEEGGVGELFAAAVLAFESANEERIQEVLKKGGASPALARGVTSALGWLSYDQAKKQIQQLTASQAPALRRVGIAAAAVHRQMEDATLEKALSDTDHLVQARACRAAAEAGRNRYLPRLQKQLSSEHEGCRFWAAWSAALLGDKSALPALMVFAQPGGPYQRKAVQLLLRRLELPLARSWQENLRANPAQVRLAVEAAGAIGASENIPWLMDLMSKPAFARVAAEAFTMITGADLDREHLKGQKPEGFEAGPTDNPEDENVEMDPDEHLPWPNPDSVRKWWDGHRKDFSAANRYLLGKPMNPEWLQSVLRTGRQRQRAAAALELALRQPGQPLFEVRAPGFRQVKMLGKV